MRAVAAATPGLAQIARLDAMAVADNAHGRIGEAIKPDLQVRGCFRSIGSGAAPQQEQSAIRRRLRRDDL
ncbi:hypothetical protein GCM10019059_11890 [Camelimonas fluminis]|nr:hypothetical protein GCM10019059_11890 [Camelimonas fluminis]